MRVESAEWIGNFVASDTSSRAKGKAKARLDGKWAESVTTTKEARSRKKVGRVSFPSKGFFACVGDGKETLHDLQETTLHVRKEASRANETFSRRGLTIISTWLHM